MKPVGYIHVCYIEEPFIFFIDGAFTTEELKVIENDLILNEYGFNDKYKGKESVTFAVNFIEEEKQYGNGFGNVNTISSYYDLACVNV